MRRLSRRGAAHVLVGVIAITGVAGGLIGAYSYGQDYYQHRGFTTLERLRRAGNGRLLNVSFYARALHRRADYLAYLPPGYDPAHRYPVDYLLHGMPGQPRVYIGIANLDVRLDNLLSQGRLRPMILVFPDGRIGGSTFSDSEWANTSSGAYENYVLNVVQDVDQRFAARPDRQARVIGGFSAGGYGAINIALHHLADFASVQAWSGYFRAARSGVFANATDATLAYNSPVGYVARLRHELAVHRLQVFMFVGRGDEAGRQIVPMARALRNAGARVDSAIYKGGHDWQLWYAHLNQMLILASRQASGMIPPGGAIAGVHQRTRHHHRRARRAAPRRSRARRHHPHSPPRRAASVGGTGHSRRVARHHRVPIGALLLALASAATINLGFLLQHRGLRTHASGWRGLPAAMLRSRSWLGGQALGWIGFAAQILAVAIAPLALVQAFAAGGLALSVPLAAGIFGYRISRVQLLAVLLIAASLFSLPIALSSARPHLHTQLLIGFTAGALLAALAIALAGSAWLRAIAAGVFYGVADAAIKAESVGLRNHGTSVLVSGWTALAIVATFGGFASFQAALRADSAVSSISLMNALAALVALGCGVFAFGESLGRTPAATLGHVIAIAIVLACVPALARAQQQMTKVSVAAGEEGGRTKPWRAGYGTG